MKETTCCFTGHRILPKDKLSEVTKRLDCELDRLISQGVTDFISGGALGFDQLATSMIVEKRLQGKPIRLILALPCRDQDKFWSEPEKLIYRRLLTVADEVIYVSEEYTADCMARRNRYMVERSAYCVCALLNPRSGTGQTVRYARGDGVSVVNVIAGA